MEEDTTTSAATDTGAETAQPVEDATTEAVDNTEASTEQQTDETQASADDEDAQLAEWAKNKGLELDSDNARKVAKIAREAEKDFHSKRQKASELEKATETISDETAEASAQATGQDPELLKRLQRVEVREAVRDFWNQPDIDRAYEPAMIELLKTKPYLAGDLDALYATAVMKSGGVAAVKSQGKREALTDLAHKQQAAVPTGSATMTAQPKKKEFKDLSIAEMEKQLGFVQR
jgi:hypothetical protein